ncbi:hypothetical protein HDV01_004009 [Terramyces sp. JEL0728]|nr:hypothetical protein HDV01_004009 [Terramyces sp. JEL0728]
MGKKQSPYNLKMQLIKEAILTRNRSLLQSLALQKGGFLKNSLRKQAWMILLSCENQIEIGMPKAVNSEVANQISLDVNRSFVQMNISDFDVITLRPVLLRSLLCIFQRFSFLHYYQGYHDICAIFLLVLGEKRCRKALPAITMIYLRDYMEKEFDGTMNQAVSIMEILKIVDEDLHRFFTQIPNFQPHFCISWILTWISHCVNKNIAPRIFDALLATDPSFILYISCFIIIQFKEQLLEAEPDTSEILPIFMNIPFNDLDYDKIVMDAANALGCVDFSNLGVFSCVNTYKELDGDRIDYDLLEFYFEEKQRRRPAKAPSKFNSSLLLSIGAVGVATALIYYNHII